MIQPGGTDDAAEGWRSPHVVAQVSRLNQGNQWIQRTGLATDNALSIDIHAARSTTARPLILFR